MALMERERVLVEHPEGPAEPHEKPPPPSAVKRKQ